VTDYPSLNQRPVLVTGGTGFIGRHLVRRLVETGARVRVLVRRSSHLNILLDVANRMEIFPGDLKAADSLDAAVKGIETVFHLGAATRESWEQAEQASVLGTGCLLKKARSRGVQRFVYVSSMAVYDYGRMPPGAVVDENSPLEFHPHLRNAYARSKCEAEVLARSYLHASDMGLTIVRPGAVYGPGGPAHIPPTIRLIGSKVALAIGGGQRQVPLLHVEDLIEALLQVASAPIAAGKIYNVVSDTPVSEADYISVYSQARGRQVFVIPLPRWPFFVLAHMFDFVQQSTRHNPQSDVLRSLRRVTNPVVFSAAAIQKEIGWRVRTGVEDGIQTTLEKRNAAA
jgi:nucleoside-diphosphate-sugar epimerase